MECIQSVTYLKKSGSESSANHQTCTRWVLMDIMHSGLKPALQDMEKWKSVLPFEIAGPLTETLLMGNLAIRSYDIRKPKKDKPDQFDYPGRNIKLLWDGANMKVTNFDDANQFVKREYRQVGNCNKLIE